MNLAGVTVPTNPEVGVSRTSWATPASTNVRLRTNVAGGGGHLEHLVELRTSHASVLRFVLVGLWLLLRDFHSPSCECAVQRLTMLQPFADAAKR